MTNFDKYADRDFITIENGDIIWNGFFYDSDGYMALVEYTRFSMSIDDYINKYNGNPVEAYEKFGAQFNQYITKEGEDNNTRESMEKWLDDWVNDATPIDNVTKDTPDGFYVLPFPVN